MTGPAARTIHIACSDCGLDQDGPLPVEACLVTLVAGQLVVLFPCQHCGSGRRVLDDPDERALVVASGVELRAEARRYIRDVTGSLFPPPRPARRAPFSRLARLLGRRPDGA